MRDVLCIIPARGGSKRLPGKNKKLFHGEPIITKSIKAALNCGIFTEVIVSSDDADILNISHEYGAHAIERPRHLATDNVNECDAYLHILNQLKKKPQYFCAIYPTAAFITPKEIKGAFDKMIKYGADACMGVSKYNYHPYQMLIEYRNKGNAGFLRRLSPAKNEMKEYPLAYASNGTVYWFETKSFIKNPSYWQEFLVGYETNSIDINTVEDFKKAEEEYAKRK